MIRSHVRCLNTRAWASHLKILYEEHPPAFRRWVGDLRKLLSLTLLGRVDICEHVFVANPLLLPVGDFRRRSPLIQAYVWLYWACVNCERGGYREKDYLKLIVAAHKCVDLEAAAAAAEKRTETARNAGKKSGEARKGKQVSALVLEIAKTLKTRDEPRADWADHIAKYILKNYPDKAIGKPRINQILRQHGYPAKAVKK